METRYGEQVRCTGGAVIVAYSGRQAAAVTDAHGRGCTVRCGWQAEARESFGCASLHPGSAVARGEVPARQGEEFLSPVYPDGLAVSAPLHQAGVPCVVCTAELAGVPRGDEALSGSDAEGGIETGHRLFSGEMPGSVAACESAVTVDADGRFRPASGCFGGVGYGHGHYQPLVVRHHRPWSGG